jgi:hypothetical protein
MFYTDNNSLEQRIASFFRTEVRLLEVDILYRIDKLPLA